MIMKGLTKFGKAKHILSLLKDEIGITIEYGSDPYKIYLAYRGFDFALDYKSNIISPAVGTQNAAIDVIAKLLTIMYNELYTQNNE